LSINTPQQAPKSGSFARSSADEMMFIPGGSRAAKPENQATRRPAAMNGFAVYARNRESSAERYTKLRDFLNDAIELGNPIEAFL